MLALLAPRRCFFARFPVALPTGWAFAAMMYAAPSYGTDPSSDACTPAYEGAQELRLDGKLVEARQKLLICAQATCPSFMQSDCAKWDAELEALVPTVILTARDGAGRYLADVKVALDGQTVATTLDGRSFPVNPGGHVFRFEHPQQRPVATSVFVPEGAKGYVVEVKFDGGAHPSVNDSPPRLSSLRPVALYTLGAVGVVGVAGFGVFGLSGAKAEDDLRGQPCAKTKTCTRDQTDPVERKYLLADISLGVGIVALGAAGYLWLSGSSAEHSSALGVTLTPHSAFASYGVNY